MTVRATREFVFDATPADVWGFISDPEKRAGAISVVEGFEVTGPDTAVWHVGLPIPMLSSTMDVETEEVEKEPPRYVKFVGKSRAFNVTGEHTVTELDDGRTRLTNEFVVDGRLPGVESFFERNLDAEMDNLEAAVRADEGIEIRE
ncbi:CoxG family protein [Halobaculum sp. MBLA0147]|uniref:CoxG family protein n=1 Tax=Halobaculum sp. MBLA0147 TaxID=3079934 RepID=UPI0035246298